MDYFDVFISCLDSHSDGTHSLHRINRWAIDVILHFLWKNKLLHLGVSEFSSDFHFCVSFKSVALQHEETQEQPEILLTLTRFQQLHISTTPLLQPVQVTAADGNPICSRAIQQSTTTCKPRGRPRRYMSSASGATHAEPVTFRPASHTAPHQRTLSLDLQTEHLITIPCFSFLYTQCLYSVQTTGRYFWNHCLFFVMFILAWFFSTYVHVLFWDANWNTEHAQHKQYAAVSG